MSSLRAAGRTGARKHDLVRKATVDALTGTFNRGFGLERLRQIVKLGERLGQPTSLVYFDLDHFKSINDTFGHGAGDLVLRAVARAVTAECRESDVTVRLGGEEMCVVLPATSLDGSMVVAERLRLAIEAMRLSFEGDTLRVTASFGVASLDPSDRNHEALLGRADAALYAAKAAGRNRVAADTSEIDHARFAS